MPELRPVFEGYQRIGHFGEGPKAWEEHEGKVVKAAGSVAAAARALHAAGVLAVPCVLAGVGAMDDPPGGRQGRLAGEILAEAVKSPE